MKFLEYLKVEMKFNFQMQSSWKETSWGKVEQFL